MSDKPADRPFQLTLRGLVVIVILIAVAVALVVPSYVRAMRRFAKGTCGSHLRSLWQVHLNYAAQYGGVNDETGSEFWLRLQRTPGPSFNKYEVFTCPDSNDAPGPGRCSYRGPAFPIRTMPPEDPIAADKDGNHGPGEGGNVLIRTGDVASYEPTDALWIRARTTTKE